MNSPNSESRFQNTLSALANEVREKWSSEGFDTGRFPNVAKKVLDRADLVREFNTEAFAAWASDPNYLPPQKADEEAGEVGEPSFILYRDPENRFLVDLTFWSGKQTGIHDHSFTGASVLLQGNTLNVAYRFDERAIVSRQVRHGVLIPTDASVQGPKESAPVFPGSASTHQIWPLGPSVISLSVRTVQGHHPKFHYFAPGLAVGADALGENLLLKQQELQKFLEDVAPAKAQIFRQALFQQGAPHSVIQIAIDSFGSALRHGRTLDAPPTIEDWLHGVPERFSWARSLHEAACRQWGIGEIAYRKITEPRLRLFLALLVTYGFGREMDAQLHRFYPEQNVEKLLVAAIGELNESDCAPAAPLKCAAEVAQLRQKGRTEESAFDATREKYLVEPADILIGEIWRLDRLFAPMAKGRPGLF